jgi:hypothetical protein
LQRLRCVLVLLSSCGCDEPPEQHDERPVEARSELPDEVACHECHADITAQWIASRHHLSFGNPDFSRAYAREPKDFCRECHAPALTRPEPLRVVEPEHLGVGCLDCHVDPQYPFAVATGPGPASAAPHELLRSGDFGTRSCARCHEFEFPPDSRRPPGTMMQTTMREHRASPHAERSCADCHMPRTGVGALESRDHSLASTRDPAAMRAAIEIQARREDDSVILQMRPIEVGHAFPTGDLFRRLELHAQLRIGAELIAEHTRYLDREFQPWRLADGRLNRAYPEPVQDDRLTGPTTIELPLDARGRGDEAVLEWWVDYERVDARSHVRPELSIVAEEIRLAEGRL